MPSFNTDIYAGQVSINVKDRVEGQRVTGDMRSFIATYTTTGAEVAADIINIVQLPVGAVLNADSLRVSTDGVGGTGCTFSKLGDAGDDDRYSATAVALTAAGTNLAVTGVNANAIAPFAVTKDTNVVQGTIALSSGSVTAGKKVVVRGNFRMP